MEKRTRGKKINYHEALASDSEEEMKKALRKTEDSEEEFTLNEVEDAGEDGKTLATIFNRSLNKNKNKKHVCSILT